MTKNDPPSSTSEVLESEPIIERGPGFRAGLSSLRSHLNVSSIGAGVISAVFGCTGPALILLDGADSGGLTSGQTVAWISAVYFVGGLISFVMGLYYKQPIVGAWSIPAAALVVSSLQDYSLAEMIGAYFLASILVLALGFTGWVRTMIQWLPMPILMAMIGGVLIGFAINAIEAAGSAPTIVGAAVLGYLLLSKFIKSIPGVIGALVFGLAAAILTGSFASTDGNVEWVAPEFTMPEINWVVILGVGIPLALVIQAENTQSMGVLIANGYKPPVNSITAISGLASIFVAPFGGHNASIAGPMTAICGSPEAGKEPDSRYPSVIVNGLFFVSFGLFASVAVALITVLPPELITALAGLAMLGVLLSAFKGAFATNRYRLGALVALIIGISGASIFGVSTPFWALLGGLVTSLVLEFDDFKASREETKRAAAQAEENQKAESETT